MGRKNRRKVDHIKRIHVNKYIDKVGNKSKKKKKSAVIPTSSPTMTHSLMPSRADAEQTIHADGTASVLSVSQSPKPHRGEIWYADLGDHYDTSVQSGNRPVLIVSNDVANQHSSTVTVLPMTTKFKKKSLPTHVMLAVELCVADSTEAQTTQHLTEDSMILAEQVTTIDKSVLQDCLGRVINKQKLKEIDTAVAVQLGMTS